jgi:hypothetical protein
MPAQQGPVSLNPTAALNARAAPSSAIPANAPSTVKPAPLVPVATPRQDPSQRQAAAPQARAGATAAGPAGAARPAAVAAARSAPATVGARSAQTASAAASANGPRPQSGSRPNAKQNGKSLPNSNVREVLKALDETSSETETTGETRMMPAPLLSSLEEVAPDDNNFTDTQVLNFLEARRADGSALTGIDVETGAISLLKPDDTGTRRALKEAVTENAPVWFAVQLQWSVQPVELSKVPPLAIFSAYTLYTVEGSRDGRKWFGLRLGFFSDAISAKQVAYYVRSEFTSVAVVPVSPQERTRASDVDKKNAPELAFPKKTRSGPVDEFKLIDSDEPAVAAPATRPLAKPAPVRAQQAAPAIARRPAKGGNTVRARERRGPQTLEETLEILGAGELEMDNGTGETLNESGVRHLRVEVQKNTPFSRLLERLSERVRKP